MDKVKTIGLHFLFWGLMVYLFLFAITTFIPHGSVVDTIISYMFYLSIGVAVIGALLTVCVAIIKWARHTTK